MTKQTLSKDAKAKLVRLADHIAALPSDEFDMGVPWGPCGCVAAQARWLFDVEPGMPCETVLTKVFGVDANTACNIAFPALPSGVTFDAITTERAATALRRFAKTNQFYY